MSWKIAIIHLWNVPGALQRPKGMLRFQAMARLWDCNTFMRAASPGILKYIRIMTWKNNLHGLEVVIGLTIRIASRRKNVSSRDQHSASSIPDLYEFRKRSASISSRMKITTLEWSEGGRSGINKSGSKMEVFSLSPTLKVRIASSCLGQSLHRVHQSRLLPFLKMVFLKSMGL
ncbi:hypothetical protein Tco_0236816 [Tanacetum coccineum]